MKNGNITLSGLGESLQTTARKLGAYKAFLFFLAVATLYGFIIWRINVLSSAPPSESEATSHSTPPPRIDPDTVAKIKSLQDNSVSVQTLFDSARQNPFQE
jgi:hypothetical protein